MVRLNNFRNNNKQRNIIIVESIFLIGLILVGISYAVYQKEDEVRFINAKVGEFETSSSDIELAMTLDGENITTPPNKTDGYYNITVDCDYATGRWNKKEWTAVIGNITSNRVKCNINFETLETFASIVELGDYISMTPTSTSYTIPSSLTGYSANQTINPSELNLWRVIRKNEDGTVDVVSEFISSKYIRFAGKTGFMNLVGGLNTIAAQYTNEKYVLKTRHLGYSNQIEYCTSVLSCPTDLGYENDWNSLNDVLKTAKAYRAGTTTLDQYWIASRYNEGSNNFFGRALSKSWTLSTGGLVANGIEGGSSLSIRPILTLKSTVQLKSGDGKSADTSYQLV